ncbi:unnamed protein product [Vicia faba]|uniref:BHLH domain-containing protein n=1 Tax=Vicia faba TaxID=3906 RepID=A0AAV0YLR6_VICFA|nr:unnamed protein product [Vicia faba]
MTLDAVAFPYKTLTHGSKDYLYSLVETVASEESWSNNNYTFQTTATEEEEDDLYGIINKNFYSPSPSVGHTGRDSKSSTEASNLPSNFVLEGAAAPISRRRKRRRTAIAKNEDEIESQRMTHIAVERNRRKQMNEYLAVLRSMMPRSYAKRGDQASIVGGAINFLKELEHIIQSMKGQKKIKEQRAHENGFNVEVTLVDCHANIKIMLKKQNGHVMKMVIGIQNLGLNILHLNVSTLDHLVLVSVSVKVEEGCELKTVDEIAAAMNQLSLKIQAEAVL